MNAPSPKGPHVLVADDDPTILLLVEHALQALGRTFATADDGQSAWDQWQAARHPLLVLDIEMPGLDGLEVCRRIRAADKERNTYILILTGRDKAADLEQALDAGADDYLTKPTTGQRLLARLKIAHRRMQDDAARRAAEDELRKARWYEGIVETTVGLQHEINNPLAGLLATAEMMKLDLEEKGLPTSDINTIIEQARRITSLVKRMSDLREAKSVEYTPGAKMVDLGAKPDRPKPKGEGAAR